MEFKDFLETTKFFYKMGFSMTKTTLDMLKVASDSYVSMYELYLKQVVPSESFDSLKKTIDLYVESQSKVIDNFKKLLDQIEKQQEEMFSKFGEYAKAVEKPAKKG
ncbi:hypothetical protein DRP07_06130 [Archaeoglobales archaeon]|nr:MAG: hypothetical protein DRP07_06130 [Archaeoglobales archaeon]